MKGSATSGRRSEKSATKNWCGCPTGCGRYLEADPENKTGETRKGRDMIHEMEDILRQARRKS